METNLSAQQTNKPRRRLSGVFLLFALATLLPAVVAYGSPYWDGPRNFYVVGAIILFFVGVVKKGFKTPSVSSHDIQALIALFLFSYVITCFTYFYAVRLNGEDFSIFDWMLYNSNHREFMTSPICNMAAPLDVCHHFGVHPNYVMVPLAWLHRLWTSPLMLQTVHAFAMGLSLIPLVRLSRFYTKNLFLVALVCIAFATNVFTGSLVNHGFHPEVFYLPFGLWFIVGWVERKNGLWLLMTLALLSVKEDAAVYLAVFAGTVLVFERDRWRAALFILCCAISVLLINHLWVQPYYLSQFAAVKPKYMRFWGHYGDNWSAIATFILQNPLVVARDVLTSKWWYFFGLMAFLPFFSRRPLGVCLAIALLFGMSNNGHMRGYATYYPAPLLPFAFWGIWEGWQKLKQSRFAPWADKILLGACLMLTLIGGGYQRYPAIRKDALTALAQVRSELTPHGDAGHWVCAETIFYPHLPYHWRIQPLSHECMRQVTAVGILSPEDAFDSYPFTPGELRGWLSQLDKRRMDAAPVFIVRSRN